MNATKLPDYLEHIRSAAVEATEFLDGMTQAQFLADRRTQNAAVMSLIVVGEVSSKLMALYPDFVVANSQIPWHQMRGMRNRITHGYFDVDFEMVWDTVKISLPELLTLLATVKH